MWPSHAFVHRERQAHVGGCPRLDGRLTDDRCGRSTPLHGFDIWLVNDFQDSVPDIRQRELGERGLPRPPYPAQAGLWGCHTLINNVETFANIPPIVRHGGEWFAGIGTDKSKGMKVFALAGRVNNTGLIEMPMA